MDGHVRHAGQEQHSYCIILVSLCRIGIRPSTADRDDAEDATCLDPRDEPRPIELERPDEAVEGINAVAQTTGRSFSEGATDLLCRALGDEARSLLGSAIQIQQYHQIQQRWD